MDLAELARNYILDRLSEEDRDECERRFLFDAGFEQLMLEQERALLDDYVNLRLSNDEADAVLRRVAQQPGQLFRLRFAESLKRAALAAATVKERKTTALGRLRAALARRQFVWIGGIAGMATLAAALVLAISTWHSSRRTPALPNQAASRAPAPTAPQPGGATPTAVPAAPAPIPQPSGERPAPSASTAIATFVLLADEQRGEGEVTAIAIPAEAKQVRLQLTTEEGLEPGLYSAAVMNAQGASVFTAPRLAPSIQSGQRYVQLDIPAARLAPGNYSIDLTRPPDSPAAPAIGFRFAVSTAPAPANP
jgi:hypothetical protein